MMQGQYLHEAILIEFKEHKIEKKN